MIHDWISFDEWVRLEAERKQSSTVIHGTNGRIEINGTPIGTVTGWAIEYDRAAERGKQMSKKQRISALEREVKLLMGTVEQLREQQRSNSSAVRSAIVSIADHQREHVEGKSHQDTLITPEQREVRNQLMSLRTLINELRAEMQKADRALGEIVTNNRNHAILDKRQAEQQLAAVQVRLAGLKEWAELTDTAERAQNERINELGSDLIALSNKYATNQSSTGSISTGTIAEQKIMMQIESLKQTCNGLGARISNMRCNVSTAQYDDMLSKIATLESALADLQVDRARASATREAAQESITSAGALAVKTYYTVEQLREQLDTLRTQVDTSTVWVRLEHVEQMLLSKGVIVL